MVYQWMTPVLTTLVALASGPIAVGDAADGAGVDDPVAAILALAGNPPPGTKKDLFEQIARGECYIPKHPNPVTIEAGWIAWACSTPKVVALVTHRGITLEGVRVQGELDLGDAVIPFPLAIRRSFIPGLINLANTEVRSLDLDGSKIGQCYGRSMKARFDVKMGDDFEASRTVDLSNAEIGGDLNLSGGRFANVGGVALYADAMHVGRDLLMTVNFRSEYEVRNRFVALGMVCLTSSTIDATVNCDGGEFINPGRIAINAAGMTVRGDLHLAHPSNDKPVEVSGLVELSNARIGGNLYGEDGRFDGDQVPSGQAIRAHGLDVSGDIEFKGRFQAKGRVDLTGARVGGSLDCGWGDFHKPNPENLGNIARGEVALSIGSATVGHDIRLWQGFRAEGAVNLERTTIGGNLEAGGGTFVQPSGIAIDASGMDVKGDMLLGQSKYLEAAVIPPVAKLLASSRTILPENPQQIDPRARPFRATGSVRLAGVHVGGNLDCAGGTYRLGEQLPLDPIGAGDEPADCVLDASGAIIDGDARLNQGFEPFGKVRLFNSKVGRRLSIAEIAPGALPVMILDLTDAQAGSFYHSIKSRPQGNNLIIEGFAYDAVLAEDMQAKHWIDWLRLQKNYAGGPHEHLATVLLKTGHAEEAKQVLLDKEAWKGEKLSLASAKNLNASLTWASRWIWFRLIGPIIGYGYGPEYSFGYALAFVFVGWLVFSVAARRGLFAPKDASSTMPPRPFVAWLYSIDLFTPVISFYEREAWVLDLRPGPGKPLWALRLFRLYWMSHIVLGWIITSLLVAGLLGLVHHE